MNQAPDKKEPVGKQAQIGTVTDNRIVNFSEEKINPQIDLIKHMQSNGIDFTGSILLDGKIHRFSCDADKRKKR